MPEWSGFWTPCRKPPSGSARESAAGDANWSETRGPQGVITPLSGASVALLVPSGLIPILFT